MYATCLRCDRPLGRNAELPHLPVGRRVAFDTATGRLWVVCRRCGQWNLTPVEERWEALDECERLATTAEAHVSGGALGLARTPSGLELLRVGGMPAEDIATWRYGRRVHARQRRAAGVLVGLAVLTTALAVGGGIASGAPWIALWIALLLGPWFYQLWQHPPRLWTHVPNGTGGRFLLGPWHMDDVRLLVSNDGGGPILFVPHARGEARLRGTVAATVLAGLLPTLNVTDCTSVDLADAIRRVAVAEELDPNAAKVQGSRAHPARALGGGPSVTEAAQAWAELHGLAVPGRHRQESGALVKAYAALRPWERVAGRPAWQTGTRLQDIEPEVRLALEMAATEEAEAAALRARAVAAEPTWRAEETVAAIADDLLVPAPVRERWDALRAAARSRRPAPP